MSRRTADIEVQGTVEGRAGTHDVGKNVVFEYGVPAQR
jgi:hypothetical protein